MSQKQNLMTSGEFAKKSGIPTAKVSELIRAGQIKAKKVSGRWQIDKSQLTAKAVLAYGKPAPAKKKVAAGAGVPKVKKVKAPVPKTKAVQPKARAASAQESYTVSEFAAMTYLTQKGVLEWLKAGRLKGQMRSKGEWSVDAENLKVADISRLVRK
jgi:predicted site-specific integrase-resolvase